MKQDGSWAFNRCKNDLTPRRRGAKKQDERRHVLSKEKGTQLIEIRQILRSSENPVLCISNRSSGDFPVAPNSELSRPASSRRSAKGQSIRVPDRDNETGVPAARQLLSFYGGRHVRYE